MKLEINLNNNLLDYIDEDELKTDIQSEVRSQIKEQIKILIDENRTNIQKELIEKIVKELIKEIDFGSSLKELLYNKMVEGIEERYKGTDAFHMTYDMDIDKIIKELYMNNKTEIDEILSNKMEEAINKYKVSDYIFSQQLTTMLTSNQEYLDALKNMLDERIYDIIEKL